MVLGGEEVIASDIELFRQYFAPQCVFVNLYGSAESSVSLQYFVDRQMRFTRRAVPIGLPVDDTEVYLINPSGQETEVYGEIAVRSPHVALRYWEQPGISRKVFTPDRERLGGRIYRTGDLGRLLPDGTIGFVGRNDFQVKIRGFRIELNEIKNVLDEHPGVEEVEVVPYEARLGEKRVVAYLVTRDDPTPSAFELRRFLRGKLPDYMLPDSFVLLDSLPQTPHGKVDRRALPTPDRDPWGGKPSSADSQTPMEKSLAEMWQEALEVAQVGVHDNFFDLGGHSLLAMHLIFRIEKKYGFRLNPRDLFMNTLGQLAATCEQRMRPTE